MDDRARVRALLGREPQGRFEVVVRDAAGDPVVIRNDPLLDDGTPMPTRYWLVGPTQVRDVSRLESTGGVGAAETDIDPAAVAEAHRRYAAERDAAMPTDHAGPRPSGGVGGTARGVKCLHAHYAWFLAGGDDPVGRWVADQLHESASADATGPTTIEVDAVTTRIAVPGAAPMTLPIGPASLVEGELAGGSDPPAPEQLTNALGIVADHLDDVVRARPALLDSVDVRFAGAEPWHLAAVEVGDAVAALARRGPISLTRGAADELFRTLATEPTRERLHNPGLEPERVETVLATCCIVLGVMRRLHLDEVTLEPATNGHGT